MNENIVAVKSYDFALRIIKLYKYLIDEKKEYTLAKQVLRCGTSIGANIEETSRTLGKKEFINKIRIAYREARETSYWLRLLKDSDYIEKNLADSLINDGEELKRILGKIISTTKKKLEESSDN